MRFPSSQPRTQFTRSVDAGKHRVTIQPEKGN
jgi:hypothetical protein